MTDQPEPLDLRSHDIAADKIAELLRLFPEIRTEGGKLDFERLKMTLGESVDMGRERYSMNWPGKAECFKIIQAPSMGTLLPRPDESINFDTTENLIIEGDNLEVLKLLQKSYLGKVKMIYIDPPYNTGNDFIYPDNYTESLQTYLEYTGQVDANGRKFGTNSDSDGRFHSRWMNMMYPRLYLARNLLIENGLIFVSIDDNEIYNIRLLLNEIFGEENFIDCIIWKKRYGGGAKEKYLVSIHEYILVYARDKSSLGELFVPLSEESITRYYKNQDANYEKRGPYRTHPLESMKSFEERKNLIFPIDAPDGTQITPKRQWRWSKAHVLQAAGKGELEFTKDKNGQWAVYTKQYLRDENGTRETKFFSIIDDIYTQHGTNEVVEIFGDAQVFGFPKPTGLISKLLSVATETSANDVVLDFFAGSGTTAQAVLELNQQDGGNRKFILVQLPEPTERTDYPSITDITKERTRRSINKLGAADFGKLPLNGVQDRGFRVFKLAESNFTGWDTQILQDPTLLAYQLEMHIEHIREGRASNDILYEILLKSGFSPTSPVETIYLTGKPVYSVAGGGMLIYLEKSLTIEVLRSMAELKPSRVICLDAGFGGDDALKANAVQIFKTQDVVFKTV